MNRHLSGLSQEDTDAKAFNPPNFPFHQNLEE